MEINNLPNFELSLSADAGFVHYRSKASARGGHEMASRLEAALALGRAHQITRLMFDSRGVELKPGLGAQYDYAYRQAWRLGLGRDWRIAMLTSPGDDSYDFLETAFINTGYTAKLFTDYDAAAAWLAAPT